MQSFNEIADFFSQSTRLQGHQTDHVCIIVNSSNTGTDEYCMASTWQTVYRWRHIREKEQIEHIRNDVIFSNTIDEALERSDCYNYGLIVYPGVRCRSFSIAQIFEDFKKSKAALKALFDWKPHQIYPDIQELVIFIDLRQWRSVGKPVFASYTGRLLKLTDYLINDMEITYHKNIYIDVVNTPFAYAISKFLESNYIVSCFHDDDLPAHNGTSRKQHNIEDSAGTIYLNNNQRLRPRSETKIKHTFDVIYAPAAGSVAEFLWKEYGTKSTKLVIYDKHQPSLEWKRSCYMHTLAVNDIEKTAYTIANQYQCKIDRCDYRRDVVEKNKKIFTDHMWAKTFTDVDNISFLCTDIVRDDVINIDVDKKTLLYVSNIFEYTERFKDVSITSIHKKFLQYTKLPNVVFYGQNVFNDTVFIDNIK